MDQVPYVVAAIVLVVVILFSFILALWGLLPTQDLMLIFVMVLQIVAGWFGVHIGYSIGREAARREKEKAATEDVKPTPP